MEDLKTVEFTLTLKQDVVINGVDRHELEKPLTVGYRQSTEAFCANDEKELKSFIIDQLCEQLKLRALN